VKIDLNVIFMVCQEKQNKWSVRRKHFPVNILFARSPMGHLLQQYSPNPTTANEITLGRELVYSKTFSMHCPLIRQWKS
jgi:hypothetical protein